MTGERNAKKDGVPLERMTADRRYAKLPPLNLFRAFDAAARHRSFRNAADELCVTPSAISQQIRQLEEFLGLRLFRRVPRHVELTHEGSVLAGVVQEALVALSRGCHELTDLDTPTILCVSTSSSLASRWLVSRLKGFMDTYPHIKITLLASSEPVDFERQEIDLAIKWGSGNWKAPIISEPLTRDFHFPVCSPAYQRQHALELPSSLSQATVLQEVYGSAWANWFEAARSPQVPFRDILYFSDAGLMLEAAIQGQGVCLTNYLLAGKDLKNGALVMPFSKGLDLNSEGYYVLVSSENVARPAISVLKAWLRREADQTIAALQAV